MLADGNALSYLSLGPVVLFVDASKPPVNSVVVLMDKTGDIYKVPCIKNYDQIYIGETGRKLGTRTTEHKAEVNVLPSISQTISARKDSTSVRHKSASCDHVHQNNHVIDWEGVTTIDREDNRTKRQIRESISIRQHGTQVMNREVGSFELPHI